MNRRLDWAEYRTTEFSDVDPERTIAILPTAAIEQHGPHLPVGTDMMIAEGMLDQFRRTCPDDLDLRILPVQAVGKSNEHIYAPGTLTLTAESALKAWVEIGLSVRRAGLRKLVIVNSHGGNLDLISIVARELRVRAGMLAVKCQWGDFGYPPDFLDADEYAYGLHGGDVETSLMLAFRPETVAMKEARNFRSTAADTAIPPIGPASYAWIASDLNTEGVVGNAANATAERGNIIADHQVSGFIHLLHAVAETSLAEFDAIPEV